MIRAAMSLRCNNPAARRFNRRWIGIALTVLFVGLVFADHRGWLLVPRHDDLAAYHGRTAVVTQVIDGDTLEVALRDETANAPVTRVRLWGIDCRELARFGDADEPLAREARDLADEAAAGRSVMLLLEMHQPRDAFGRVLAHVDLGDGRLLNEALLLAGLARTDDRWPHTRLTRYAQLELAARREARGMWARDGAPPSTGPAAPES